MRTILQTQFFKISEKCWRHFANCCRRIEEKSAKNRYPSSFFQMVKDARPPRPPRSQDAHRRAAPPRTAAAAGPLRGASPAAQWA